MSVGSHITSAALLFFRLFNEQILVQVNRWC